MVEMTKKGLVDTHLVSGVAVESAKVLPQKKIERVGGDCRMRGGCLMKLILV